MRFLQRKAGEILIQRDKGHHSGDEDHVNVMVSRDKMLFGLLD